MPYTYILKSLKDNKKYIGSTINLEKRLRLHFNGQVTSTKYRRPLKLYGYRKFDTIAEASHCEKKYKHSHEQFERDIKNGKITLIGV